MLASPIIEGTLPAFYVENGIAEIAIPFSMSRAVNESEISGFSLKLKNVQGSTYLLTISSSRIAFNEGMVYFTIPEVTLKNSSMTIGSFYKAQLAYVDLLGVVGYYSTVGVIKYTTKPEINILNLKQSIVNTHNYEYVGTYSQAGHDVTEKVYSYRFYVKNKDDIIVEDTGFIIHNNANDLNHYESQDTYFLSKDLRENERYTITYVVRTNNNLEISSPAYKIMAKKAISSPLKAEIKATLNFDNGYVLISLDGEKDEMGLEKLVSGTFVLMRSSEKTNYTEWEELADFSLTAQRPSASTWKDFTIQQGIKYQYSIQQYNKKKLYSDRILSNIIYADFEDCFLYDGERQLKIRFNSKISSFKTSLLESKVNTIGAKYPFTFRNGQVEFKEFPIQGLISYYMDEEGLFDSSLSELFENEQERHEKQVYQRAPRPDTSYVLKNPYNYYVNWEGAYQQIPNIIKSTKEEEMRVFLSAYNGEFYLKLRKPVDIFNPDKKVKTTNPESYNVALERQFKIEVLDWLNDGKTKLFKSPTEGNYIVRLINNSLSPNDQTGRMIHNFSSTAYEVADLTYENLVSYGVISANNENKQYFKIMTIPLATSDSNYVNISSIKYVRDNGNIYYATGPLLTMNSTIENALLYDLVPGTEILIDGQSVLIGASGTYEIPLSVAQISLPESIKTTGYLTVAYFTDISEINSFDQILDATIVDVLGQQFIGTHENILKRVEDTVNELTTFYNLKAYTRPIDDIYISEDYVQTSDVVNKYNYMNYYVFDEVSETYVQATEYSWRYVFYSKQDKLYLDADKEVLLATLQYNSKENPPDLVELFLDNVNLLNFKRYQKTTCNGIDWPLYRKITFSNTGGNDYQSKFSRAKKDRTVTNSYLMDYKDFNLLIQSGQLYNYNAAENTFTLSTDTEYNAKRNYYVAEPIECLFDPTNPNLLILSKNSYEGFQSLWSTLELDENVKEKLPQQIIFERLYQKHQTALFINSEGFDLTEKNFYQTGNIDKPNSIELTNGVYCELYYQKQILSYDISKIYQLTSLKAILDDFDARISKEKMLESCIYSDKEDEYIKDLEYVRERYDDVYRSYIVLLDEYLKSLQEV